MSSTHKRNNVCFDCRNSYKGTRVCPDCGKVLIDIGYRWRVPPKNQIKKWKQLVKAMRARNERMAMKIGFAGGY